MMLFSLRRKVFVQPKKTGLGNGNELFNKRFIGIKDEFRLIIEDNSPSLSLN